MGCVLVVFLAGCANVAPNTAETQAQPAAKPAAVKEANAKMITGRCHCGQVRYEAAAPAVKSSYCDCPGCRKASGALKAPFVTVRKAGFRLTVGEVAQYRAASGERCDAHGVWNFCPKCGSPVFWAGHKGDEVDLFAGTLDDPAWFQLKE